MRTFTRRALLGLSMLGLLAGSCSGTRRVAPAPRAQADTHGAPTAHTQPGLDAAVAVPSCPRVERAKRMYSGFAEDIPQAQLEGHMHVVLDVIVPIQRALGELFCVPGRARCRPDRVLSIEVADLQASRARVTVSMADETTRELVMLSAREDEWRAEPNSLAALLVECAP